MKRHPRNPILTRADIPDIPPLLHDVTSVFNPGAVERADTIERLRHAAPSGPGPLARDLSRPGPQPATASRSGSSRGSSNSRAWRGSADGSITSTTPASPGSTAPITFSSPWTWTTAASSGWAGRTISSPTNSWARSRTRTSATASSFRRRSAAATCGWTGRTRPATRAGRPPGSTIWLSESDDLLTWRPSRRLIDGRFHLLGRVHRLGPPARQDAARAGSTSTTAWPATSAAPTSTRPASCSSTWRDPSKVLGRCRRNILEPRETYELAGQVPNVVFPSGMIVENVRREGSPRPDSPVKVYYGAADTAVGLAETTIAELLAAACGERDAIPNSRPAPHADMNIASRETGQAGRSISDGPTASRSPTPSCPPPRSSTARPWPRSWPSSATTSAGTTAADLPFEKFPPQYKPGLNRDDFGTVWRVETAGICGIPVEFPIPDLDRYGEYRWPADFRRRPPVRPPIQRASGGL